MNDHQLAPFRDLDAEHRQFRDDILKGLARSPKRLPSKYFYDDRGSALFEQICDQPEYYLTRTELALLEDRAEEIAAAIGPRAMVVEYGSGSGIKTERLLDALVDPVAFVPIEISPAALQGSLAQWSARFPQLELLPLCADFSQNLALPAPQRPAASVLIFFPGSTLGNLETTQAVALMQVMAEEMGDRGAALIGIDLVKETERLEAAYNDAAGVTAAFTLNLLGRVNRELDADFDLARFAHRARFNEDAGRIETHLVSGAAQQVQVAGQRFAFAAGEAMLVEYSAKYTHAGFAGMAAAAGLRVDRCWTDRAADFALCLLRRP